MAKHILIRTDGRVMYQQLADTLSAIEPPIWMMLHEQSLKERGNEVCVVDAQVESLNIEDVLQKDPDHIEIFPTGNHPSAYIQQRDGLAELVKQLPSGKVRVHSRLDFNPVAVTANWNSFCMDKYRAHNWHCGWGGWGMIPRAPYGAVFTSVGCPFHCQFCCIKDYYGDTYAERPLGMVITDIDRLVNRHKTANIKVMDEIFFLKKRRVEELCDRIIAAGHNNLNLWAYARVDTVSPPLLEKLKTAGFHWLALGIESGNENIRKSVQKGNFTNEKIAEVVSMMKDAGINVAGNFIFGFPDDTLVTMRETIDFAKKLKCEFTNLYSMMAYPGSELHLLAQKNDWPLPQNWSGYSQYSHDCHPIRTKYLTSREVLKFRDNAFMEFYSDAGFKEMILKKFGPNSVAHLDDMLKIKLRRKLLEEEK